MNNREQRTKEAVMAIANELLDKDADAEKRGLFWATVAGCVCQALDDLLNEGLLTEERWQFSMQATHLVLAQTMLSREPGLERMQ